MNRVVSRSIVAISMITSIAVGQEQARTVLDTDTEFDEGSGISTTPLTSVQVENLAVLARMWGFLKYHHPRVATGELHWDYELFRVLPLLLDSPDTASRNDVLLTWAYRVSDPPPCDPCAAPPEDAHLLPRLNWIDDEVLGRELSEYLKRVHQRRISGGEQFYVSAGSTAPNAQFPNESDYADIRDPDMGYRLLALFRYWNIVQYWFPYIDAMDDPWDGVLYEFIPRIAAAEGRRNFAQELWALISKIDDSHAGLQGAPGLPPVGRCALPVGIRYVEGRPIVTLYTHDTRGPASGLEIGDVIQSLDGELVTSLVPEWSPYYPASNETGRLHKISTWITRGACEEAALVVERDGQIIDLISERSPFRELELRRSQVHDRPGPTFQMLFDDVAYLKLSTIAAADIAGYFEAARGTQGLIIDIRNYPAEFVVFELGTRLVNERTPFVWFARPDFGNPGAFNWNPGPAYLDPQEPYYGGKVVVLVDETTLSQAEYTAMALRTGPNVLVVGSTTAGADGNISAIPIPGGMRTIMTGLGVFYADKSPTQRVGIVPDVFATPTVSGIRQGRDEVLEQALREIFGGSVDEQAIRAASKPPVQ